MRHDAIIFDLDGTLLDTLGDLTSSLNRALGEEGLPPHPPARVRRFIGNGVDTLIRRAAPATAASPAAVQRLGDAFRRIYHQRWAETTAPYPGVADLLDTLASAGLPLAVLSNKPHEFTVQMVRRLLQPWTFDGVIGAGEDFPLKPDPAAALHLAAAMGVPPRRCALVGDSQVDMATALAADMTPVAVTWGFRDEEELRQAVRLAHTAEELAQSLLE